MAVVVLRKNEGITSALLRFHQQVIREGVIFDILKYRYWMTRQERRRLAKMQYRRIRKRRKRRARKKPPTKVPLKITPYK